MGLQMAKQRRKRKSEVMSQAVSEFARRTQINQILEEMHKIAFPGEYGLGTEKTSIEDDKAAWVRMGELVVKLQQLQS